MHRYLVPFCLFLAQSIAALSQTSSGSFKIVGIPSTPGTQLLPETYVKSFVRWKIDEEGHLVQRRQKDSSKQAQQERGTLQIRPTLDFLIKGGVPAYVMAGLEVSTFVGPPLLAQQWLAFATAVEPNFRLVVYKGPADGTDDRLIVVNDLEIRSALEKFGVFLSQATQAKNQIEQGFHIVSMPLSPFMTVDALAGTEKFTCMLTAEPDAREIFTLDADMVEMTATSILQLDASTLRDETCSSSL